MAKRREVEDAPAAPPPTEPAPPRCDCPALPEPHLHLPSGPVSLVDHAPEDAGD